MKFCCLRNAAAAVALAAVLGLAAPPAHAAGWPGSTAGPGWIENAWQWIARLWVASETDRGLKAGMGIDPNGGTAPTPPPPPPPNSDAGHGIDPNG